MFEDIIRQSEHNMAERRREAEQERLAKHYRIEKSDLASFTGVIPEERSQTSLVLRLLGFNPKPRALPHK